MKILPFESKKHQSEVVILWKTVFGYGTAHNQPELAIAKKLAMNDGLFFVALDEEESVIGTVMMGYDGHRGWIYSLAVSPEKQKMRIGSRLMQHAETILAELGCMKINLQIAEGNEKVEAFYKTLGFSTEKRISMGKVVPQNLS